MTRFQGAVLLASAVAVIGLYGCGKDSPVESTGASTAVVRTGELTCFGQTNPGDTFPRSSLANPAGAESADGGPNQALNKWLSSSAASKARMDGSGWIELQKSASLATFGLPMNGFGLVAQVNVEKQGPSWNVVAAKPCFLTVSTPGSVVVPVYKPKSGFGNPADPTLDLAKADELTACGGPSPQFKVVETARSISVLATYPWDVQKQQVVGANTQPCGGTVEVKQFAIKLKKPLGSRKIIQSGYVPVRPVGDLGTPQPAPLGYRQ